MIDVDALTEEIAREMCAADGLDPDEQVPDEFAIRAADSTGHLVATYGPRWHTYRRAARHQIAAFKILRKY